MENIIIELDVSWEKQGDKEQLEKYCPSGFHGGWTIMKSPKGYPEINGGNRSPDFTHTEESLTKMFKERYSDRGNIIVKFNITQDDRPKAMTLDRFFN